MDNDRIRTPFCGTYMRTRGRSEKIERERERDHKVGDGSGDD